MKLLKQKMLLLVFISEIFSLNLLIYFSVTFGRGLYFYFLLGLLFSTHLICLLSPRFMAALRYRLFLVFFESILVLYFYQDFNLMTSIVCGLFFLWLGLCFIFWNMSSEFLEKETSDLKVTPSVRIYWFLTALFLVGLSILSGQWVQVVNPNTGKKEGSEVSNRKSQTGYTDKVSLFDSLGERSQGSSKNIIHFFISPENIQSVDVLFPYYLLKSNTLNFFDGIQWSYVPSTFLKQIPKKIDQDVETLQVEAIKEATDYAEIPHPYSTKELTLFDSEERDPSYQPARDSWKLDSIKNQNTHLMYFLSRGAYPIKLQRKTQDLSIYLSIPKNINLHTKAIQEFKYSSPYKQQAPLQLAFRLFRKLKQGDFKVRSFQSDPAISTETIKKSAQEIIETFLFEEKAGFCDLFSTVFALLLRSEGIPTRIVSGFRISSLPFSGVLTVKEKDAHAWVEAWFENQGWVVFDPTPSSEIPNSSLREQIKNFLTHSFDSLQAFFLVIKKMIFTDLKNQKPYEKRIIMSFDILQSYLLKIGAVFFIGGIVFIFSFLKFQKRRRKKKIKLSKELQKRREKMISRLSESGFLWLKHHRNIIPIRTGKSEWMHAFDEWCLLDEKLRFGPDGYKRKKIRAHCSRMDEIFQRYQMEWKIQVEGIKKRKTFQNELDRLKKSL